jgi:hypothetical protein
MKFCIVFQFFCLKHIFQTFNWDFLHLDFNIGFSFRISKLHPPHTRKEWNFTIDVYYYFVVIGDFAYPKGGLLFVYFMKHLY